MSRDSRGDARNTPLRAIPKRRLQELPTGPAARVHWISPGAVLTVLVWAAGSELFSYYLANFGAYNEIYGSIGAVIALMMFLYITIFVVLLGAALNAELHDIKAAAVAEQVEPTAIEAAAGDG